MFRLFDRSLSLNGFPIKKAKIEFLRIVNLSDSAHEQFVDQQKSKIVAHHLANNSFYQKLVPLDWNGTWESLPVLTKQNLQVPLENRLSAGYARENVFVNKTSGSSGDPFVFAKDKFCHAMTWASNMHRFGWHGIDFNHSAQARFYGIPLDFWGYRKERLKDFLSNRYRFSVFDLSDRAMEQILRKFQTTKFDYVNGYTSSIVLFAKFLATKNIVLKTVCPSLKTCFVTAEMLFANDRMLLETQFGIPIINEYGASELDLIAFENLQGDWLLNAETIFVEILDDQNQAVPIGTEGRVVITSLFNKAHPFIRYAIGDIGVLDERSTLRKPILKQLLGRTNDFAVLPSGKKAAGLTFYYITKSIIEDDGNVKEFVIRQVLLDTFEIDYVSQQELTPGQIGNIEQAIATYLEPNLRFSFHRKKLLLRSKRGKLKQFESMVKPEN